jgi:hypothetical protein
MPGELGPWLLTRRVALVPNTTASQGDYLESEKTEKNTAPASYQQPNNGDLSNLDCRLNSTVPILLVGPSLSDSLRT